ncbi:MAG TPA: ShlB/FhaC/HecB family hemolysin secretion/activation protein [Candidatus Saccharimonadales bacterium]|nr:ShlB/FhaC/HecB family hemolysin secretion/activation protein [Candidatus Saccharimonadales bacterium]
MLALCAVELSFCLAAWGADTTGVPALAPTAKAPAREAGQTRHFAVDRYDVAGNTLLPQKVLDAIFSKHTGTNITFDDIASAEKELQMAYHSRGYDTISVTIPEQRLTNAVFKIRVFEGRLAEIRVTGNRFYSSNNVMRALPGLKTNIFLNSKFLQPQLDLANANQDRQIYPEIHPGPESNTTALILRVKDRIPLHAKLEANDASTEGTPDQRLATSVAYDNLWQLNHQMGLQYTFSEEAYKQGGSWAPYDHPLVANYSGFYRMPLSAPESFADNAAGSAGKFGYNEATRKFVLPPPTGATELNLYASGSTIDTGVVGEAPKTLFRGTNGIITQQTFHQDLTYNDVLGFRLLKPLPQFWGFTPNFQAGLDYKTYREVNYETNDFTFYLLNEVTSTGQPTNPPPTVTPSPVPATMKSVAYLPLALRLDASRPDAWGTTDVGFGYNPNVWYSGTRSNLESIAGSARATGFWHIISASVGREQILSGDWKVALRADGQWASEPLISNEQFGAGGIAGVRGYHEGEVFGDCGWRVTSELKLPPYRIGCAGKGTSEPLIVRASAFMDYADTYLLDPQGRNGTTPLWGAGLAGAASFGSHFSGMLSFGWPLLSTPTTELYQLRIAFSLSAQF